MWCNSKQFFFPLKTWAKCAYDKNVFFFMQKNPKWNNFSLFRRIYLTYLAISVPEIILAIVKCNEKLVNRCVADDSCSSTEKLRLTSVVLSIRAAMWVRLFRIRTNLFSAVSRQCYICMIGCDTANLCLSYRRNVLYPMKEKNNTNNKSLLRKNIILQANTNPQKWTLAFVSVAFVF